MKVKVDNKFYEVKYGETLFDLAIRTDIEIPFLCKNYDLPSSGSCRVCVVEVKGEDSFKAACQLELEDGMEIKTESKEIIRARRINLELLFSQHQEECDDCVWNPGCKLLSLAHEYKVDINRFSDRKKDYPNYSFDNIIEFDSSKCIDCQNCIVACPVNFLEIKGKSHKLEVTPGSEACVYCGQCIAHCPAGAFESVGEFEKVSEILESDEKIIFQIAPATRISIGEEFGEEPGKISTGKLISGLKKLGAYKVFDTSRGADFTTEKEARELLERVKEENLPLFTACCPAWVRFVEYYYPEYINNLTTVRSPHIILGGLIKLEFKNVKVVSIMPCTAKKYEVTREELKVNSKFPVDKVLTVREVGRLFRNRNIDFHKLKSKKFDDCFGEATGSGVSYGSTGGVLEATLKKVARLTGNSLNFNLKKKEAIFGNKKLRVARISGLKKANNFLKSIKKNNLDYVEVMACPNGCVGGGGQPLPIDKKTNNKRLAGLKKAVSKKEIFMPKGLDKIKDDDLFYTKYKKQKRSKIIDTTV